VLAILFFSPSRPFFHRCLKIFFFLDLFPSMNRGSWGVVVGGGLWPLRGSFVGSCLSCGGCALRAPCLVGRRREAVLCARGWGQQRAAVGGGGGGGVLGVFVLGGRGGGWGGDWGSTMEHGALLKTHLIPPWYRKTPTRS